MKQIRPYWLVNFKLMFTGSDYVSKHGISFAGITTSGMEIVLRNTATNEILCSPSDKNGLFYVPLQEGKYCIDDLYVIKEGYDGFLDFIFTNPAIEVLEIEKGKVNNIGTIQWSPVMDGRHFVIQTKNPSEIQTMFSEQFPESKWNTQEWIYNPCYDVSQSLSESVILKNWMPQNDMEENEEIYEILEEEICEIPNESPPSICLAKKD